MKEAGRNQASAPGWAVLATSDPLTYRPRCILGKGDVGIKRWFVVTRVKRVICVGYYTAP